MYYVLFTVLHKTLCIVIWTEFRISSLRTLSFCKLNDLIPIFTFYGTYKYPCDDRRCSPSGKHKPEDTCRVKINLWEKETISSFRYTQLLLRNRVSRGEKSRNAHGGADVQLGEKTKCKLAVFILRKKKKTR